MIILIQKTASCAVTVQEAGKLLAVPLSFITFYAVIRSRTHVHSAPLPVLPPDGTVLSVGSLSATLSDQCGIFLNILPPEQGLCQVLYSLPRTVISGTGSFAVMRDAPFSIHIRTSASVSAQNICIGSPLAS